MGRRLFRDGGGLRALSVVALRVGQDDGGFPNWFFIGVGQNALSANVTSMFDDQAKHLVYIIKEVRSRGAVVVEATPEAEQSLPLALIREVCENLRRVGDL